MFRLLAQPFIEARRHAAQRRSGSNWSTFPRDTRALRIGDGCSSLVVAAGRRGCCLLPSAITEQLADAERRTTGDEQGGHAERGADRGGFGGYGIRC
jgi:hypothetical protein